jgi:hypothetical protein
MRTENVIYVYSLPAALPTYIITYICHHIKYKAKSVTQTL